MVWRCGDEQEALENWLTPTHGPYSEYVNPWIWSWQ
jgi:hypothetical protein